MMKTTILAALLGSAAAFAPSQNAGKLVRATLVCRVMNFRVASSLHTGLNVPLDYLSRTVVVVVVTGPCFPLPSPQGYF